MELEAKIVKMPARQLLGLSVKMSVAEPKISELWQSFGPKIPAIENRLNADRISMNIYPPAYFSAFNPQLEFEKWAAVEVSDFKEIPPGLQPFTIPAGLYVVFHYQGSSDDPRVYQYIFTEWLNKSQFQLDARPHFEVLGSRYRNLDPNSEEDIWIPIA